MNSPSKLKIPKISDKPSEAIRQAIKDLRAIEKLPGCYAINMDRYHGPKEVKGGIKCEVCLAGAVIARAGNDPMAELDPWLFSDITQYKLKALDYFRCGDISNGLKCFREQVPEHVPMYVEIVKYSKDPALFKKQMMKMAKVLERSGL
jgi:hypothetical protein